jgi:hypothetical protein
MIFIICAFQVISLGIPMGRTCSAHRFVRYIYIYIYIYIYMCVCVYIYIKYNRNSQRESCCGDLILDKNKDNIVPALI